MLIRIMLPISWVGAFSRPAGDATGFEKAPMLFSGNEPDKVQLAWKWRLYPQQTAFHRVRYSCFAGS
ncbi:hypothetical protein [Sphingobium herbicidovorans]|uniref:hypothetical protein n=1 Tax=Sphingobium herbicidovorans TaxID=76947 RepID=UPI0012E03C79|nr:hypothetical protein [Sphingobium herbicidovorans]